MPSTHSTQTNAFFPAKDIIRMVETINGHDDVGIETFINTIKRAKVRCSQLDLLLDFILTEKIQEQAKKSIRFIPIHSFDDLYATLRQSCSTHGSVESFRSKLEYTKQR